MHRFIDSNKIMRYATEAGLSPQTRFDLHRDIMCLQIVLDRELKKLKQEITNDVLKEIAVKADVSDAIKGFDEVEKAFNKLKGVH